jgi:anti-anti-sigma regulatory factor
MVLPLDFAVLSGVVFSLAFFVIRSSLPRVVPVVPDPTFRHFIHNPDLPVCPQLGVLNIRGPLFFGAVYHLEEELRHNHQTHPGQNNLVLRMHGVDICDLSGIEMLESTVRTYRQLGGDVFLVRPRRPVLEVMEHSGFIDETLGRDHILEQEGAIEYLFDQVLDPAVCIYECEHRVFAECQALEKHPYGMQFPPVPRHIHRHDRHVSPETFQELADDPDAMILDVREPAEYNQGHVPGAGLLPLRLLPLYGVEGGTLAWRAAGLPITGQAEDTITVTGAKDFPAMPVEAGRQRRAMTAMRIKNRTAKLAERLALLSTTGDLSVLRGDIERLLDQLPAARRQGGGCVHLDPKRPVLIVSDSHALRGAFHKLLQDKYVGSATNLESIVRGDLQLLLLGDILHSESKSRWQTVVDEYMTEFTSAERRSSERDSSGSRSTDQDNSHREIGPTPSMDKEMANAFGLAAMIMTLQRSIPGFYCLKGNHDNLLNSEENGNGQLLKHVSWPGEGEIARAWTMVRFGTSFAGKYAAWENSRPIFTVCNGEDDFKFVASHSEPAGPYTLDEIEERSDEVVFGLTWTRNKGQFAPDVLRNVFGREWLHSRYFVSHTGSEEGIVHLSRERLVIVNKPRHLVAALVQPGTKEFEVHIVAGP